MSEEFQAISDFMEGRGSKIKYYTTFDEMFRQYQTGGMTYSYTAWSITPGISPDGTPNAVVVAYENNEKMPQPGRISHQTNSSIDKVIEENLMPRVVFYFKFEDVVDYNDFFKSFVDTPGSRISRTILHDLQTKIVFTQAFEEDKIKTMDKQDLFKLTKSQWRSFFKI